MVYNRGMFVELLEDGRVQLEPEREKLTADELRWLDEEVMPELRCERAKYEAAVRRHLREVHVGRLTADQQALFDEYRPYGYRPTRGVSLDEAPACHLRLSRGLRVGGR